MCVRTTVSKMFYLENVLHDVNIKNSFLEDNDFLPGVVYKFVGAKHKPKRNQMSHRVTFVGCLRMVSGISCKGEKSRERFKVDRVFVEPISEV